MQSEENQSYELTNRKLSDWQEVAFAHFKDLTTVKAEKAYPVFALEHNFSKVQLLRIGELLVKDFEVRGISHNLWLLWVIYATELGYEYTGDEYWQSFERKLKSWDTSHRQEISWAFSEFQRHFRGIVPTGIWAQHFRIISQPITNAILPRDLQAHFAHLLFISRHQLKNVSIEELDLVAARLMLQGSAINSTRFQNFLEQKELVAKIAIAVLADDSSSTENQTFIHHKTLQRIVNDIEITASAKEWIRQARKQTQLKPKIIQMYSEEGFNNAAKRGNKALPRIHNMIIFFNQYFSTDGNI